MKVSVQGIERNDAKANGPREVVYDVKTEIDAQERTFEVCVSIEQIGSSPGPAPCSVTPARCVSSGTIRGRSPLFSGVCSMSITANRRCCLHDVTGITTPLVPWASPSPP
jgi:hypothetical protein